MPRKLRLFVSGGIYHVYCRTHRGEMRFDREVEANTFVGCVAEVSSMHRFEVLGWTLMGTHYHLVVRTGDVKLWRSMATIQCKVTREHNRCRRVLGAGWQSRYRARLVQSDQDLRNLLAYVHLNPVVAGLVHDPADYELSGHRELIGRAPPVLVNVAVALNTFGEETLANARAAYLEYVRCVAEAKWARGKLRELPWWKQVKNDHETVDAIHAPPAARTFDNKHPDLPTAPKEDLVSLLVRACHLLGQTPAVLAGASRQGLITLARRRFAFIATCHFQHRSKAVAKILSKSPCQVSRWLAAEMAACSRDSAEAAFIDYVTCQLLDGSE